MAKKKKKKVLKSKKQGRRIKEAQRAQVASGRGISVGPSETTSEIKKGLSKVSGAPDGKRSAIWLPVGQIKRDVLYNLVLLVVSIGILITLRVSGFSTQLLKLISY